MKLSYELVVDEYIREIAREADRPRRRPPRSAPRKRQRGDGRASMGVRSQVRLVRST